MKVAEHMPTALHRLKKAGRHRVSYRAARRNLAKIAYRLAKRRARA